MLIYDIEIVKAIPPRGLPYIEGIEYCGGWHDKASMGVSVIGALHLESNRPRVFTKDNFEEFVELTQDKTQIFAGFNSIPFDNEVLAASGIVNIPEDQCYDLLREVWTAAGLGPRFCAPTHIGYSLDEMAAANGLEGKTGNGAFAPVDWQRGKIGTVIDYCLQDVTITAKLIQRVMIEGYLICPKTGNKLKIRHPMDKNG